MRTIGLLLSFIFFFSCKSQDSYSDKNGRSPSDVLNDCLVNPILLSPVYSGEDIKYAYDKGLYSKAQEAFVFKKEFIDKFGHERLKEYKFFFAIPDSGQVSENGRVDYKVNYQGTEASIYFIPGRRFIHFKLINDEWVINDYLGAEDKLIFGKIFWSEQRILLKAAKTPEDLNESAARKNDLVAKQNKEKTKDGLLKAIWPIYSIKIAMQDKSVISQSPSENALKLLTFIAHGETESSKNFGPIVKLLINQCKNDLKLCANDQKSIIWFSLAQYAEMVGSVELENLLKGQLKEILKTCQSSSYDDGSLLLNYSFQTSLLISLKNLFKDPGAVELLKERTKQISKIKLAKIENQFSSFYRANYLFNCSLLNVSYPETLLTSAIDDVRKDDYLMTWLVTFASWCKGGDVWKEYNKVMNKTVGDAQKSDGLWNDNLTLLSRQNLNTYNSNKEQVSTGLAALSLTIYYRYLPLYKNGKGALLQEAKKSDAVPEEGLDLVD